MEDYRKIAIELGQTLISKAPETRKDVERMLPELKESEDERIRKDIIWCLKHSGIKESNPINPHVTTIVKDAIAWLEKQGQVKDSAISQHENKTCKENGNSLTSEDERIRKAIIECVKNYGPSSANPKMFKNMLAWLEAQGKNNMGISEDTKQKLEDNLNKALEKETPESWNEFLDGGEQKPKRMVSAEAKEAMYDKPAWSEEDETVLNNLIYALANDRIGNDRDEYISYLKSLKDRNTWKPSDRELSAILTVIGDEEQEGSDVAKELLKIYHHLKKLKA